MAARTSRSRASVRAVGFGLLHERRLWFEEEVKPRLRGRSTLIRHCDDFILTFEREEDVNLVVRIWRGPGAGNCPGLLYNGPLVELRRPREARSCCHHLGSRTLVSRLGFHPGAWDPGGLAPDTWRRVVRGWRRRARCHHRRLLFRAARDARMAMDVDKLACTRPVSRPRQRSNR